MISDGCIFCRIVAGEAHAHFVHRDDICTAFLDVDPFNPGLTLIIPNRHAARLSNLSHGTAAHLFTVACRIATAITGTNVQSGGFNLFLSDGECAGQEVPHVHLHVLPRFPGDGLNVEVGRDPSRAAPRELAAVASEMKQQLASSD
jgi:histidine triad (HIT) family protein